MKSNEQAEYCRSGSAASWSLGHFAKNRYINYLLYLLYFTLQVQRHFTSTLSLQGHFTSNLYVQGHFTSTLSLQGHFTSDLYVQGHFTSTLSLQGHFTSDLYAQGHFTSTLSLQGHFTSDLYVQGHFTSTLSLQGHFTSNLYDQGHFTSTLSLQGHFTSDLYVQGHFTSTLSVRGNFTTTQSIQGHFVSTLSVQGHLTFPMLCSHLLSCSYSGWLCGVVISVSDSRSRGPGFDSRPVHCQATTLGKLLTPMCLCHQAVQFGISQRSVMLCGREGNWPWGADFSGLSTYGLTATDREMSTPPMPIQAWSALPLPFLFRFAIIHKQW